MSEHSALVAAARLGLPPPAGDVDPVAVDDVDRLVPDARFDGMAGFLAGAVGEGRVTAGTDTGSVVEAWHEALAGVVVVEALVVRAAEVLDAADVRWRLTKGAAVAHRDYPEHLSMRTFGDVDVVIHPGDWATALEALATAGYERPSPELRPRFDVRFGKGATLHDPNELELDLHLRFAVGRFGVRSQMEDLFERGESIELAGRPIPVLNGSDRLLHACHHLVLGGFSRLRAARDVAQMLLVSEVSWVDTVRTATSWGVVPVVARGIGLAWDRLRLDVDHPAVRWAGIQTVDGADARTIAVFEGARPFREQALTAVSSLPPYQVPAYLGALAVPASAARGSSSGSRVGHVVSRARRLARR